MGDLKVTSNIGDKEQQNFMRALLADIHALEQILEEDLLEAGIVRIGAEQEMFLIDAHMRPRPVALEVISEASDKRLTSELALFNLEANLSPQIFHGSCLKAFRQELEEIIAHANAIASNHDANILLTGILPTLRLSDLSLNNMTPAERYIELDRVMREERGGAFEINIRGTDELHLTHENVMLESCNTSLQLHLQVSPHELPLVYNIAQAVAGPLLAASVNSPLLLNHRLWSETRIALFEHSIDLRSAADREKGEQRRVYFGDRWLTGSALEYFRENVSKFRPIMRCPEIDEDPRDVLKRGKIPKLSALQLHSGTVYRWNRICYGTSGNSGHLRIENRVLPSGPSITDEVANAAFFFGMMFGLKTELADIAQQLPFDDVRDNFFRAARLGLDAQLRWVGGKQQPATKLILDVLLPTARRGLESVDIDSDDIEHYLGVLEARVRQERTGAQWIVDSLKSMTVGGEHHNTTRNYALVESMAEAQKAGIPVSEWPLASVRPDEEAWRRRSETVGQIMTTELFSARPDDIIDLAANLMDWHQVRHVPVEERNGNLAGLVSHRDVLRAFTQRSLQHTDKLLVRDIMLTDPVSVLANTPTMTAIQIIQTHDVSALPVLDGKQLIGIVTQRDLMKIAVRILEQFFVSSEKRKPRNEGNGVSISKDRLR
ncbi:MAG: CBS domain-containing protein [Myxococcales bacterium]|nr:CBS domain-containing protein [Myxococcales bacterium]